MILSFDIGIKNLSYCVMYKDETYDSINKNNIKIGVVDIPIIHSSPGLTNPNNEFYEGQKYFIKKWKR